jgi:hypothetical protein
MFIMRERTILAALAVLVSASSAIGLAGSPASAEPRTANAEADFSVETSFTLNPLDRLSLINGKATRLELGSPTRTLENLSETMGEAHQRGFAVRNRAKSPDPFSFDPGIDFSAMWQVKALGQETDYWVVPHTKIWWDSTAPQTDAVCEVYRGNPEHGGKLLGEAPFICTATVTNGRKPSSDVNFDVRLNRLAEVSGTIKAVGSVSLVQGEFTPSSKLHLDGAVAVSQNTWTQFDTVLASGDEEGKDTARMKFQYALLDDGKPVLSKDNGQPLYVFGNASNRRAWEQFIGGSSCHFITLDDHIETHPDYTCTTKGAHAETGIRDGRVHYVTDFTVNKIK